MVVQGRFFMRWEECCMTEKIVIRGAGPVGSHCAYALASCGVGREIVLVDIIPEKAAARANPA